MKERIIQVFYFDEYGVKRIRTRVRTAKPVDAVLKAMGLTVYDHEERKQVLINGYMVEELPTPEGGAVS